MKNIHILPTEIPGRFSLKSNGGYCLSNYSYPDSPNFKNQNIYITSDEEIKEGDWYITTLDNEIYKADRSTIIFMNDANKSPDTTYRNTHFKIILTTDKDLIKDGVQEIDDEFLEWFVENPNRNFVRSLKVPYFDESSHSYVLIIPKEEDFELVSIGEETVKLTIQMMQDKEEIKQETIEQAAERLYPTTINSFTDSGFDMSETERLIFINGAKWQQEQEQNNENSWFNEYQKVEDYIIKRIGDKFLEATPEKYNTASEATIALLENNWQSERMYSEEEVHEIILSYQNNVENSPNHITYDEWFEQYKKNQL